MNSIRAHIYNWVPKTWRRRLGKSKMLKPLRDLFFRSKTGFREHTVTVNRNYEGYAVSFQFVSGIQIAVKAETKGLENTLLRNSIKLLKEFKPREGDDYYIADVGANFGYLSLVWSQSVAKNGTITAFEPHPKIANSLQKSIAKNGSSSIIDLHNVAVGKEKGSVEISLLSTTSNTDKEVIGENQSASVARIEMVTLDDFFSTADRLDMIKIDVDGIELQILEGAANVLKHLRPIVIVEANGNFKILEFLVDMNYTLLDMNLRPFAKDRLPPNIFCIPK